jgi:hypothetical protein
MKFTSFILAVSLCAAFFAGCSTGPAPRLVYERSEFASGLEYLRFCQRNALHDHRCD